MRPHRIFAQNRNLQTKRPLWYGLLGTVCLAALFILRPALAAPDAQPAPSATSFVDEVILLTNQERTAQGLPPLKANPALGLAAQVHADAMAVGDFFDHVDPNTGADGGVRATAAGYNWGAFGENIAAGATSPQAVVQGWMESPGHRANLLSPDFREIGVGYTFEAGDAFPSDGAYRHYWVQLLATAPDNFPVIIDNEAITIASPQASLYIYGANVDGTPWAQEMRLRNDGEEFGAWQPYQSQIAWTLPPTDGNHTVTVELRNGSQVVESSDSVFLNMAGALSVAASSPTPAAAAPTAPGAAATPAVPLVTTQISTTVAPVESLRIGMELIPPHLIADQEAEVVITLAGQDAPVCEGGLGQAVDAVFVFDISASAGNGAPGSNWYNTVGFTRDLFASLSQPVYRSVSAAAEQSQVGMVSTKAGLTGPEADVLLPLTADVATAIQRFAEIEPGGDTNIADGLREAQTLLAAGNPDFPDVIFLMLHDNVPLAPALNAAQEAIAAGAQIYIVANSVNIAPEDQINAAVAAELTGDPARFLLDPTPDDLRRILVQASGGAPNRAATSILVRSDFDPRTAIDIVDMGGGVLRNGELTWEGIALNKSEQTQLRYRIRARADAPGGDLQRLLGVAYLDCNGYLQGAEIALGGPLAPASPPDVIQAPTPTSSPTPTELPTVTSTPAPTVNVPMPQPPGGTATPGALLVPSQALTLTLCPGEARTLPLVIPISGRPARADVLLAFDVSESMAPVLAAAAANANDLAASLRGIIPDVQIGVVIFNDYPLGSYGDPGDTPYALLQAITSDDAALTAVLNTLPDRLQFGGDPPEAYTRMLYEAAEDPAVGWRPGARHFLIVFGDGVARPTDPGRDGVEGTGDDLALTETLSELAEEEVLPLMAAGAEDAMLFWQPLFEPLGGEVVQLTDTTQLVGVINDLITRSGARINRLAITAAAGYETWLVNDGAVADLLVGAGITQTLNAVIMVPPDAYDGIYRIQLDATGDGGVYTTWQLIVVTENCGNLRPVEAPLPPLPFLQTCDSWFWVWVAPLLLPLLLLLLWLLIQYIRWWRRVARGNKERRPPWWRCGLPCLLALVWLLWIGFLFGQRLAQIACVGIDNQSMQATMAGALNPALAGASVVTPGTAGANGSERVALAVASGAFNGTSDRPEAVIEPVALGDLDYARLSTYDTLVVSQVCNISDQPRARLDDIVRWVGEGHKLIIYDSDECSGSVDYNWLPYPFYTNNPGALGSTSGSLTVVADDTLIASDPTHPGYIDPAAFAGIEIGDANVIVTDDYRWCGNIEATNANGAKGFVHAYSRYRNGLIIYNGFDTDNIDAPGLHQLWQQELDQPWDSVAGAPIGLPCQRRVAAEIDPLAPFRFGGLTLPWWALLLPLPFLWLLCWLGCRPLGVKVGPVVYDFPTPPPPNAFLAPPEPLGRWDGPPAVWNPEKTLIIGLGGTGRWALTLIKKNLLDAGAGDPSHSANVRLLLIDTTPEEEIAQNQADVSFAGVRLSPEEILSVGEDLKPLIDALAKDPAAMAPMASWFPANIYAQHKESELDLRRSTGGERPLGRAAAFNDLAKADASHIWGALLEGIHATQEGEQARVMIVSSLAGGFGSAVLADVAYLARHAARKVGARFASVEAYLVTQRTFDGVVNYAGQRALAVNTFATLQELRRFQLQGVTFPYHIRYTLRYPGDPVWDGQLDRPLLDDTYLFDGYRPDRPLLREKPVNGVLAILADTVTLHLDRNSRLGSASVWAYRRQMQGLATDVARQNGQAAVGSAGIFAYRLPVYDITQALAVRWAKHLIGYFVVGEAEALLRLDAALMRERFASAATPRALAESFVRGTAQLDTPPAAMFVVGNVLTYPPAEWSAWCETVAVGNPETEQHLYADHLTVALTSLLNGFDADSLTARTGKLQYALDWLDQVAALWKRSAAELENVLAQLTDRQPRQAALWRQLPELYRLATQAAHAQLADLYPLIGSDLYLGERQVSWRSVRRGPTAVFEHLLALETLLQTQRQEMATVVTRRYFMDDALLDRWYRQYLADKVVENVGRLYWAAHPDGGVDLAFNGMGTTATRLRTDGGEAFARSLMAVALYLAQDVWEQETLATYLAEADLRPERTIRTADEMWATSTPLLDFDAGHAPDVQTLTVLGVNETVRDTQMLEERLAVKLPSTRQLRRLDITDPYTMLVARFIDAIPADATTPFREAEEAYRGAAGLTFETAGQMSNATPRVVFPAERVALRYQQRLPEINQMPRLFHPLFVAALEDEERAVLFVKALAAGLVQPAYREGRDVYVLATTAGEYVLSQANDIGFYRVSPTIGLMLNFVKAPDRVRQGVLAALGQTHDVNARWRRWQQQDMAALQRSQQVGDRDLAAFAALVLADLLRREDA